MPKKEKKVKDLHIKHTEWIRLVKFEHKCAYDYSLIGQEDENDKNIKIICKRKDKNNKKHGVFTSTYKDHANGEGCPKCDICKECKTIKPKDVDKCDQCVRCDTILENIKTHNVDFLRKECYNMASMRPEHRVKIILEMLGEIRVSADKRKPQIIEPPIYPNVVDWFIQKELIKISYCANVIAVFVTSEMVSLFTIMINHIANEVEKSKYVNLVSFWQEDIGAIDKDEIINAFKKGEGVVQELLKVIHQNPKHLEYRNIDVEIVDGVMEGRIFKNGTWVRVFVDSFLDVLYDKMISHIKDLKEEMKQYISAVEMRRIEKFLKLDKKDRETMRKWCETIEKEVDDKKKITK